MLTSCTDVILCKGTSDKNEGQEEYVKYLTAGGYNCNVLSTLDFEFVNLNDLSECLSKPHLYSGLILTSPRSIKAISAARQQDLDDLWRNLPAYCVGPKTEALAKDCLKVESCEGSHCGNSKDLAQYILEKLNSKSDKPLLYPCSDISRDTIEKIFSNQEVKLQKIIVYKTLPSRTLEDNLLRLIKNSVQIFVFFSPSNVEYLLQVAHENSISLNNIKSVALGPVTGEALAKAGLRIYAVAEKPEPGALLEAVKKADMKTDTK